MSKFPKVPAYAEIPAPPLYSVRHLCPQVAFLRPLRKHDNDLLIHYPLPHLSVLLQIEATSAIKHTVRQMHKHVHIKRKCIAFSGCIFCDVLVLAISPIIRPLH